MTTRAALLQLRDRLAAATGWDTSLDCAISKAFTGDALPSLLYTGGIDAAVTLFGPDWLLISLSEIAADGLSIAKFGTTETPCQEAIGIGGRTLALTICLAKVEYELARTAPP